MKSFFIVASIFTVITQGLLIWTQVISWHSFLFTIPVILLGTYDLLQRTHSLVSNYPLVGRLRFLMEILRPKFYQYFVESDTDGTPISRIFRSVVYQRAKGQIDTTPFGTQLDTYAAGYEWIEHSMRPLNHHLKVSDMRVIVGEKRCQFPYSLSMLNISAMSYGSLSPNAVEALNLGAKLGNFAHNTGEGGIAPFHQKGGDLIWQLGTGYFGARTKQGTFCLDTFKDKVQMDTIKMVEIKLSQGAKPGHGGILPAKKNIPFVANIRGVQPYTDVLSPPSHSAFSCDESMLTFIEQLRQVSGKPIGIKMCVGNRREVYQLLQTFARAKSFPDYIAIDGGEGGTGAAPLEFSNSVGTPAKDGLHLINQYLNELGIRQEVKIIISGKILTGFSLAQYIALGADAGYSARGMMLALGCIQALTCNTNHCPTGVATQDPGLYRALDVDLKAQRVKNFHHATLKSLSEITAAAGLKHPKEITKECIYRRISPEKILSYQQIYGEL